MTKYSVPVVGLILFVVLWEVVRHISGLPQIILPSVGSVANVLGSSSGLYSHTSITALETIVGFVLGNTLALSVSVALVAWPDLDRIVLPYAIALKTTPVVAFVPILIIWFGSGQNTKILAAAAVCFFPTLINSTRGLRSVPQKKLDLFQIWGTSWRHELMKLRIPTALPYIFSGLKISSSLALVGAVVAEFVAADEGLGFLIVVFSRRLDTAEMFAAVFVTMALGIGLFWFLVMVERLFAERFRFVVQQSELV